MIEGSGLSNSPKPQPKRNAFFGVVIVIGQLQTTNDAQE
jgi:hypothetical protein